MFKSVGLLVICYFLFVSQAFALDRIVFSSYISGNSDVYSVYSDGSFLRQLTSYSGSDANPRLSPDGRYIVFDRYIEGNREIYTMRANGSKQTRITYNPDADNQPTWEGNNKIVFVRSGDGDQELYEISKDGGAAERITNNLLTESNPIATPSGSIFFVASGDEGVDIFKWNSGDEQNLTNNSEIEHGQLALASDKLLFVADRYGQSDILQFLLSSGETEEVLVSSLNKRNPAFSPNGEKIALQSNSDQLLIADPFSIPSSWQVIASGSPERPSWGILPLPELSLATKPSKRTRSRKASFRIRSSERIASSLCRIDKQKFRSCGLQKNFFPLQAGFHSFDWKARDINGRKVALPTYRWRILP